MKTATSAKKDKGQTKKATPLANRAAAWPFIEEETVAAITDPARLHQMIATAAYYRAEHRGFEPGHETEDWLAAEGEITHLFASMPPESMVSPPH